MLLADAVEFDDEDGGVGRDREAGHGSDFGGRLADAGGIDGPVGGDQEFAEGLLLFGVAEVGFACLEGGEDAIFQGLLGDDGLLAGADGAVVEGLAFDDFGDGVGDVGRAFEQDGNVAGPDAEGRFAAGVGGVHDAVSAGGEDDAGALVAHQGVGAVEAGVAEALDDVFGGAGFESGAIEEAGGGAGAADGARVRAEDDGVAGFEGDQDFVDGGGGGVGGGQNGGDDADGNGIFDDAFFGDFAQHADGAHAAHPARQQVGVQQVFGDLIFDVAVAGFFDGHGGEGFGVGAAGGGHAFDDGINLRLVEGAVLLPGGVSLFDLGADLLNGDEVFVFEHQPRDFLTGPAPGRTFSVSS